LGEGCLLLRGEGREGMGKGKERGGKREREDGKRREGRGGKGGLAMYAFP